MSKINFAQLVTAEEKSERLLRQHQAAAKAECRGRILGVVDEVTQMNIANALLTRVTLCLAGQPEAEAAATSGLSEADVDTVLKMRLWVAEMTAVCTDLALSPDLDVAAEEHWPAVPPGLIELASRF